MTKPEELLLAEISATVYLTAVSIRMLTSDMFGANKTADDIREELKRGLPQLEKTERWLLAWTNANQHKEGDNA